METAKVGLWVDCFHVRRPSAWCCRSRAWLYLHLSGDRRSLLHRYGHVTGSIQSIGVPFIRFSPLALRDCAQISPAGRSAAQSHPRWLQSRAIAVRRESPSYYRSIIILYRTSTKYYKHPQESSAAARGRRPTTSS